MDENGNVVPAADFQPIGLRPIVEWILNDQQDSSQSGALSGNRDVYLLNVGENKILAIKEIREITGLGLKDAKDLVDAVPTRPSCVIKNVSFEQAQRIASKLERAGCATRLTFVGRVPKPDSATQKEKASRIENQRATEQPEKKPCKKSSDVSDTVCGCFGVIILLGILVKIAGCIFG